ncbi:MAG: hypothetical protein WCZ00_06660 [Acholeplasmataceae bacterium]
MNIKSMAIFNNMGELASFTSDLDDLSWQIEKEYLKDRVVYYSKLKLYQKLKKMFNDKQISIFPLKEEEVITWIDTLCLLKRLMILLFKKGVQTDKISIIMEYPLIFGNHMRADYLLIYDHLLIVLEFGMFNQDERRSEERYTKKLQESISYRQLLSNLVSDKIDVVNYVMIYRPEFCRLNKLRMEENIVYNSSELDKLCNFITHLVKLQDESRPFSQLNYLESIK